MKTYADYLNTLTVKRLREIAKQMQLTGYSKANKDDLIRLINDEVAIIHIEAEMSAEDYYVFDGVAFYGDLATMMRIHDKAVRRFNPSMRRDKSGKIVLTPAQRRRVHKHDRKASKILKVS